MVPPSPQRFARPLAPDVAKVLWRGTTSSVLLMWAMVAIFTATIGFIVVMNAVTADSAEKLSTQGWIWLVSSLAVTFAASTWSMRASVEVDDEELRVRFGLGWPTRHIRWERVARVEAINVRPMDWGGWGYKIRPRQKSHAVVLRAGEGLKVTLDNDHVFIVTVDHTKRALEVIREVLSTKQP
mgnify:CR=1 FL=1